MTENEKDRVTHLAIILYADLPFWKRWKVKRFYDSNNWDVTKEWTKCVRAANKMMQDLDHFLKPYTDQQTAEGGSDAVQK